MPKLLIMAGGTGGHIFPALAVAEQLRNQGWELCWMGTAERMEADIVPQHAIKFTTISVQGLRGKGLKRLLQTPFMLLSAIQQARNIIIDECPDVVLGMGGYASGPGGIAAKLCRIPLVLHEQNAVFGLTNRYLAKIAKRVLTGFEFNDDKYRFVGNPVRSEFLKIPALAEPLQLRVLVVGGSLGAKALNDALPHILNQSGITHITHQTGKHNVQNVRDNYQKEKLSELTTLDIVEFIDDMPNALASHDIIICRAGALTVAEVAAAGRLAIFVPLPHAVDDHQTKNAEILTNSGAAYVVAQHSMDDIASLLTQLINEQHKIVHMAGLARTVAKPNATADICQVLEECVA